MDQMWAPWRMEYIAGPKTGDQKKCFLCVEKSDDEQSLVVTREGKAFAIMNRYPYANGHLMIVPVRHVGSLEGLTDEELLDMMRLVRRSSAVLRRVTSADGLNVGINLGRAAGAGLEEHVHIHVVPRWFGDTNFMPVLGETKVISEHLYETCRKLREGFVEKVL